MTGFLTFLAAGAVIAIGIGGPLLFVRLVDRWATRNNREIQS